MVTLALFHRVCHAVASLAGNNTEAITVTAVGSAAVLPWLKDVGREPFWPSRDVDVVSDPASVGEAADFFGEFSDFYDRFAVYAEAIPPGLFVAPSVWKQRAKVYDNPHADPLSQQRGIVHRVRVPAPIDLVVSKLMRADEGDWEFADTCFKTFKDVTPATVLAAQEALRGSVSGDDWECVEHAMAILRARYS